MTKKAISAKPLAIRETPNWGLWKKRRKASIANAVALSLNISPGYLPTLRKTNLRKYSVYATRLKTACLAVGDTLHPMSDHKAGGDEPKTYIVELKHFVPFALAMGWGEKHEGFKDLGNTEQKATPEDQAGWVTVRLPYVTERMQAAFETMKKYWPTPTPTLIPPQKVIVKTIDELLGNTNREADSRTAQELAAMIRPDEQRDKDKRATKRNS
jgi:hypothetical protein